uniref:Integrase core domain containing protein n=1 Tax=Solanum tuberosum TaxID=4113 RepID=M1DMX4_SOLTU
MTYEEDDADLDGVGATGAIVLPTLPPGVKFTITSTMIQRLNLKEVVDEEEMGATIEERLVVQTLAAVLMNFEADFRDDYVETVNVLEGMGAHSSFPEKLDLDLKNMSSPPAKPSIEEPPVLELK